MRRKPKPHRDPVTLAMRQEVLARDRGCVTGALHGTSGARGNGDPDADLFPEPCIGRLEIDHVLSSGLGRRGPSTLDNLVTLCWYHHRWKTENARAARPPLLAYLLRLYPPGQRDATDFG